MTKQSKIIKLAKNPLVRRVAMWLAPIVIGYITRKLTGNNGKNVTSGRKHIKNKAR